MNPDVTPEPLSRLVGRSRNRLWLGAVLRRLDRALCVTALALPLLGVVHLTLWPAPGMLAGALLLLPPAAALLYALARERPTAAEASRRADRLAGADSLLLTGWELLSRPSPLPTAAPLVIEQALASVPTWQARLQTRLLAPRPRTLLPATVLTLLGYSLLLFPGAVAPTPPAQSTPAPAAREAPPPATGDNALAGVIRAMEQETTPPPTAPGRRNEGGEGPARHGGDPSQGAPAVGEESEAGPATAAAPARVPLPDAETGADDRSTAAGRRPEPMRMAERGRPGHGTGRDIAGDNPGGAPALTETGAATLQQTLFRIQRRGDGEPPIAASATGLALATPTGAGARPRATTAPGPARLPEPPPVAMELEPTQRGYLNRYFQTLQRGADE
ncbi:MAG TPA: hypothetical protein ENK50_03355 [Sedimenticola sp.]|nr:hypothetical protein [Sedimenticola sp.]